MWALLDAISLRYGNYCILKLLTCVVVCVVGGGAGLLLCDVMRMWRVNCGWSRGGVLVTALVEVVQSTQCVQ